MANRDKDRLGSAVSLQGSAQPVVGEAIPREYHRRILKKIAQLTKVIYTLNTKLDENEQFVASLRSIHEAENRRLLDDSSARLKRCEEEFVKEKEAVNSQVGKLGQALEKTRKERDELYDKQVSYRKEVEEKLSALKSEHTTKVQSLAKELEQFQQNQTKQLKQISDLRDSFGRKSNEQLKALKFQHEEDLSELRSQCEKQVQKLQQDIVSLKSDHSNEIESLNKQFQSQLEAQSKSLTSAQKDLLADERRAWEEKETSLNAMFSEKEEQLKQQVSCLSKELRASNDKLALAEQKVRDLEAICEENSAGSGNLRALLEKSEGDIERLRTTVGTLHTDLDIARENYNQQAAELAGMSGTVGKLEALRVSNAGVIENLRSQIASLQGKLKLLEEEREGLETTQQGLKEKQATTIRALEREVDKIRREKQELHAQFAREIEAAHAQLSHRETELEDQHLEALRDLREEHARDLSNTGLKEKEALNDLKLQLLSQKEEELHTLQDLHSSELSKLRAELTDKTSQLQLALEEVRRLKDELLRGEKGLGSVTSQVEQLRSDLQQSQNGLLASQSRCEETTRENGKLKSTVDSMRKQKKDLDRGHVEELKKTRADLTAELEAVWKERVKRETASLRTELSHRHNEETQAALAELAGLKDEVMRQEHNKWDNEKKGLLEKIESLEGKLRELELSASVSIEEVKSTSDNKIDSLRKGLDNEMLKHREAIATLEKTHQERLTSIQAQFEQEKQVLSSQLKEQHRTDIHSLQQANQLAVNTLREKMEAEKKESMRLMSVQHCEELKLLETSLGSKFDQEMSRVNAGHVAEIEKFRHQIESIVAQSQRQVSIQETTANELRKEIESRDSELSMLRDKTNSLTVAVADMKKQLTMKEQELQMAKREAKNTLRIREQQLVASHHAELESINSQQRHKAQQLVSDFNKAKTLLSNKIHELERQLNDWEHRYRSRDSKPEDLEMIRELRMIVRGQEQKMKDLVAEKRVYQLELMNREKNYNKLFSVSPQVGVLNPLQTKQRKQVLSSESQAPKYASAPSLLAPSPELPSINPITSHPHLAPLPQSKLRALSPNHSGLTTSGSQLSKKSQAYQSSLESKPQKLVMLRDSPLTHKKSSGAKHSESTRRNLSSHSAPETHSQTVVSPQKHTMVVQ